MLRCYLGCARSPAVDGNLLYSKAYEIASAKIAMGSINEWSTWSIFIGFLSVELFLDVNIQANRMLRTRKCGYAENDSIGASSEPRLFVLVV